MAQATTTKNGFNTVSQSGSGIAWTNLSNMPYPTEGEASAALTGSVQEANRLALITPYETANIETGATFNEMALYLTVKKTGTYSASTNVTWSGKMNFSSSGVWTYSLTADEAYRNITISGDRAYWRISAYSPSDIIEYLKTGTLYFQVDAQSTVAIACGIRITAATCEITYTTVDGEHAAIIATLV